MQESKVTVKGQTTLPSEIRHVLGLTAGDKIRYILLDGGEVRLLKVRSARKLAGMLHDPDRPVVSLEDMEAAIVSGASE